jgi:hypothetical protein
VNTDEKKAPEVLYTYALLDNDTTQGEVAVYAIRTFKSSTDANAAAGVVAQLMGGVRFKVVKV